MTPDAPTPAGPDRATAAVVILGADAVLAALPSTAVQLFHACLRAGYVSAVPASWGDELVAEGCLAALNERAGRPAVFCSCPIVAARLSGAGSDLSHALIPLVAPPVAAARYMRKKAGSASLHVTYVGACPLSDETSIDEQLSPAVFLDMLAELSIKLEDQPTTFDDVLPPDRRRHLSLPGGPPCEGALAARPVPYRLVEISSLNYAPELAQLLMGDEPLLLDVAPRLGCACSGAVPGMAPANARAVVMALEPARSQQPVVDELIRVEVRRPLPSLPARRVLPPLGLAAAAPGLESTVLPPAIGPETPGMAQSFVTARRATPQHGRLAIAPVRRTPPGNVRQWAGAFPRARSGDGSLLPRAYVARRHSSPVLVPIPGSPTVGATVATATPPAGEEFAQFVAGLTSVVARHVTPHLAWRQRLDAAIVSWRSAGYDTSVLQRARGLSTAPNVDGLLDTFAAAVTHLARLEERAADVRPSLRGAPIFRDPRNVAAAESLVNNLLDGPSMSAG